MIWPLLFVVALLSVGQANALTASEWHRANPHSVVRETAEVPEGITHHVDEVSATGNTKGSYRFVSALNKPDGSRGFHSEDLWREGKWASFEPVNGKQVRVATTEPHSVREGDVLHLDKLTAAHVRKHEDPASIPALHYRVTSVRLSDEGEHVEYGIRPCALNELFQDLSVELHVAFPKNSAQHVDGKQFNIPKPSREPTDRSTRNLRGEKKATSIFGAIHNMAKKAYKRMESVASKVNSAIKFATSVFNLLVTGDMSETISQDLTVINYHYDTETDGATCTLQFEDVFGSTVSGTCDNCYAYAGLEVKLVLEIEDYVVKQASVTASGGIDVSFQTVLDVAGEYEAEDVVFTYTLSKTVTVAGIPIPFVIDTPVTLSLDASAKGQLPVDVLFRAMVDAGISFDPAHPSTPKLTNQATFDAGGDGLDFSGLTFSEGSVSLGIRADAWVQVYNMGGPVISIGATPEIGMEDSSDSGCLLVSCNVGVEGTLAGKLYFDLPDGFEDLELETPPVAILNTKRNIHTGCVGSGRRLLTQPLPPVGTVYDGSIVSTCTGENVTQTFSAQVTTTVTNIQMELILNAYGATSSGATDSWEGYIFNVYDFAGSSTLVACNALGASCQDDYGSYEGFTGTPLINGPMLCTYDYDTTDIMCDSIEAAEGCSKVTMRVNPLSGDLSSTSMSIEDIRAQTAATICPKDEGSDNDDDAGSAAPRTTITALLLSVAIAALVAM